MSKIFSIKRKIGNKFFLRDEDRITARNWFTAYLKLMFGILDGRFDSSCRINGVLICEIPVTDDEMLDIMIDNGGNPLSLKLKAGSQFRLGPNLRHIAECTKVDKEWIYYRIINSELSPHLRNEFQFQKGSASHTKALINIVKLK